MAQVNTSDVFPSLRVLETDASGDLLEVTGSAATFSSALVDDVTVTAKTAGDNNSLEIKILDNQGGSNNVVVSGDSIEVRFAQAFQAATGATADSALYNNAFTISAVELGDLNGKLQFSVIDNVLGATANEVKVSASDGDISVCLFDDISTGNGGVGYTNQDIYDLLTDNTATWYNDLIAVVSIGSIDANEATNAASNASVTLSGGVDASGQYPSNGTLAVASLINNSVDASAIVVATGGSSSLPTTQTVSFSGGTAAVASDLDFSSKYVCLKIDEIHSLLESEAGDARKVLWGILETYTQYVLGQSVENQPENFIVARGNPTLVIDQAGTRLRQTYTANAFYAVGDLDLESETA